MCFSLCKRPITLDIFFPILRGLLSRFKIIVIIDNSMAHCLMGEKINILDDMLVLMIEFLPLLVRF